MKANSPFGGQPKVSERNSEYLGVLVGCFGRQMDGPGLPGGLIIYQGHLFAGKK